MFTVYSASAGSGKTYNLVLDYLATCFKSHLPGFLRLSDKREYRCERCSGYQDILAITFTNNAGAEMKDRVIKWLNSLTFASSWEDFDSNDFQNLCHKVFGDQHNLSPEECFIFLKRTSNALLNNVLYDYARFSITTIDSFMQRLIRSSALYLNLSMNYAVQIRLNDFYRIAIEQYICELSNNEQQFRVVVQELTRQLEDHGSANIRRFLTKSLNILYQDTEKSHPFVKNLSDIHHLQEVINEWWRLKIIIESQCKKDIEPLCDQALNFFLDAQVCGISANQSSKWDLWFQNLKNDPFNVSKGFENSKLCKTMDREKIFKTAPKNSDLRESYIQMIETIFAQVQQIVLASSTAFYTYRALIQNANYLLVLNALANHVETIKEQTDTFFLSESNPLVNDEIQSETKGEPLFEKIKYEHFFIDEFQDTSLMQWQDLKQMIINALSVSGSLTLFGDVKQSIYRFRNGDVDLFYHLMDYNRLMKTAEEQDIATFLPDEHSLNKRSLNVNYRSQSAVIRFNNHFFDFYARQLQKESYYSDVVQQTTSKKTGGLVQIFPYGGEKPYRNLYEVWPDCPESYYQQVYPNLRPEEAELVYAVMNARKRGYEFGDMAVLLRGRAKCNTFAQRLMAAGIPVVTSDSLQLCDNDSINMIISTLRLIINPEDSLSQATLLYFFADKFQISFQQLLMANEKTGLFEVAKTHLQIFDLQGKFVLWEQNPLLITIKEIIRFYDFSQDKDPFIADFLDLVHEYVQTQVASVAGFLGWWDDLHLSGESIPRLSLSGASGAVRLMTIHASKGLEYPVVITWCNNSVPQPTSYWVVDDKTGQSCYVAHDKNLKYSNFVKEYEEEEDKRLLDVLNLWYVDFTRACDMLYILTEFPDTESDKKADVRQMLKQFAQADSHTLQDPENETISIEKQSNEGYYFGDLAWRKEVQKQNESEEQDSSMFRVSCSEMTFLDNPNVRIESSEGATVAKDTGTYIHRLLQQLQSFPVTEEEREAFVRNEPEEIRTRLLRLFREKTQEPRFRPYFYLDEGDQVLNEATIITENGTEKRPDRIVFKPDHVMIIDYKTGQKHEEKYKEQLIEYQEYLKKMGYKDVRWDILYIDF